MSRGTLDPAAPASPSPTGLSPSPAGLSRAVPLASRVASRSPYPGVPGTPVWAPPGSLAATSGIDVSFFSSGYLDVSVRRVPPARLPRVAPPSARGGRGFLGRVSPFRHLRVNGHLLLAAAFRSLSRLSSALSAKASTLRSFLLDLASRAHSVARPGPLESCGFCPAFLFGCLPCFSVFLLLVLYRLANLASRLLALLCLLYFA